MNKMLWVIKDYISQENTDYAILVNGTWGCGKTYFFKNRFPIYFKKYFPSKSFICISLNGVSQIDELPKKLFFAKYSLENADNFWVAETFKYFGSKAVEQLEKFGVKLPDIKINFDAILNLENCVVFFDDLERVKIDVAEVFGFLSNLVESSKVKVVLIAHEGELISKHANEPAIIETKNKDPQPNKSKSSVINNILPANQYLKIKEKVIARTIPFECNKEKILKGILKDIKEDPSYVNFCIKTMASLISILEISKTSNFRYVKHAIFGFQRVYSIVKGNISDSEVSKYLLFYFAAFQEFNSENRETIVGIQGLKNKLELFVKIGLKKDPTLTQLFQKYFPDEQMFNYSQELINYVINGYFSKENILIELIPPKDIPEKDKKKAFLNNFYSLSDEEFQQGYREILKQVEEGQLSIRSYPKMFSYFEFFAKNEALDETEAEIFEKFKNGIKLVTPTDEDDLEFERVFFYGEDRATENFKEISRLAKEKVDEIKVKINEKNISYLKTLFHSNLCKFIEEISSKDSKYLHQVVFNKFPVNEFYSTIINFSNNEVYQLISGLNRRYNFNNIRDFFAPEEIFFKTLGVMLNKYLETLPRSLKKNNLKVLINRCCELSNDLKTT